MERMYLPDVEAQEAGGHHGRMIRQCREAGSPFPQIWHLFTFKPKMTDAL